MKKIGLACLVGLLVVGYFFSQKSGGSSLPASEQILPSVTPSEVISQGTNTTTYMFVPYWTVGTFQPTLEYDTFAYFGVTVNKQGLDKTDSGYKNLQTFVSKSGNANIVLVLRMTDSEVNSTILRDNALQKRIAQDIAILAKQEHFSGVVWDFELSSLAFDSTIAQISAFSQTLSYEIKKQQLNFYTMLYGDVFFRFRPYDVAALSRDADGILVMAYDFHKARGDPGPNFPLSGKQTYGYDYQQMVDDFLKYMPAQKITIVFGMFGYDWEVNDKKEAIKTGVPLSMSSIKKTILERCDILSCQQEQNPLTKETKIFYREKTGQMHIVWFEDLQSVDQKIQYLKKRGIFSTAYWAYSYF